MSTQLAGIPKRPDERIGKEPVVFFQEEVVDEERSSSSESNPDETLCCPLCEKTVNEALPLFLVVK
jgi:hypothetical protein